MLVGGHKWILDASDWDANHIHDLAKHNAHEYLLEADVDSPENLHALHNELPFMPELMDDKLISNLLNKQHYISHIRTLNQALSYGLIIQAVH